MNATEKLALLESALGRGETVYVSTYTKVTQMTPKVAAKWAAAGRPFFKVAGKSLYMASGKSYVCIDYCALTSR